ncbi:CMRF35-like molecule 5 [Falco cherrug]|uniref:CMRF35-like molecule 5 n=1 Tax=Falco cherrug TaxID=345164 RepID=UPI00247AD892|nr:CMRF35-like molecule 5 [Falco cherrug]
MRIFLVWTLFPGGWAVTGPMKVMADQGGSLTVSCSYEPGYELYSKYWCRPSFLWFCFTYIAQTNGSEVMVTQGRVSIRDNHMAHSFTVTLGSVTLGDAGWYSCGVRRRWWFNQWHTTEVTVSTAGSATTKDSDMSLLATNSPYPTGSGEPAVVSQLSVTYLLLFLSVKVLVALMLACGATWVRSRHRTCGQEDLQLFEAARTPACPPSPTTSGPQGCPPAPLPPTLLRLCHPPQLPHASSCLALGASPPAKSQPLLASPVLETGGSGAQRGCIC